LLRDILSVFMRHMSNYKKNPRCKMNTYIKL
jgi:hypothetical protein